MEDFTKIITGLLILSTLAVGAIIYTVASNPINPNEPPPLSQQADTIKTGNFTILSKQVLENGTTAYFVQWHGPSNSVFAENQNEKYAIRVYDRLKEQINVSITTDFYAGIPQDAKTGEKWLMQLSP